jgi:hypothetical protein
MPGLADAIEILNALALKEPSVVDSEAAASSEIRQLREEIKSLSTQVRPRGVRHAGPQVGQFNRLFFWQVKFWRSRAESVEASGNGELPTRSKMTVDQPAVDSLARSGGESLNKVSVANGLLK